MEQLAAYVVAVVLVNQFVVPYFPSLSARADANHERQARFASAAAAAAVLVAATPLLWLTETWLLVSAGLADLRLPAWVLAVAAVTGLATVLLRLASPALVLLDATLLGVALLVSRQASGAADAIAWAIGAGAAFVLGSALFADLRERLDAGEAPRSLRGAALVLVTAGLFMLGFTGLASVLRG